MYLKKLICAFILVLINAGFAHAGLDVYIRSLNIRAEADMGDYRMQLGIHYGASPRDLDLAFKAVASPAEVAIILWLGKRCNVPVERVVQIYRDHKGQGWGAIAKSLGIKPGSADFHALKQGNLGWQPAGDDHKGKNGKGKGGK